MGGPLPPGWTRRHGMPPRPILHPHTSPADRHALDGAGGQPRVGGRPAAAVLEHAVEAYCSEITDPCPTSAQIGAVLRALADYATLEAARTYRRPEEPEADFHPTSTSMARFLHDVADTLDRDGTR